MNSQLCGPSNPCSVDCCQNVDRFLPLFGSVEGGAQRAQVDRRCWEPVHWLGEPT